MLLHVFTKYDKFKINQKYFFFHLQSSIIYQQDGVYLTEIEFTRKENIKFHFLWQLD